MTKSSKLWFSLAGWGPGTNFFWSFKFEIKIFLKFFLFQSTLDYDFLVGAPAKLFLATPNLRSKSFRIFSFTEHSGLNFSEGGREPTVFGQTKFEIKKISEFFFLLSALDWIFHRRVWANFWSHQIWDQKFFRIFFIYRLFWTLNFSGEGGLGTNFFWSCQIWVQKVFRIFFSIKHSGILSFQLEDWSRHQHFMVMLNLRSTTFRIFSFTEQSGLWIFHKGIQDTNIFWSHQIWSQKFFRIFCFTKCSGLWICQGLGDQGLCTNFFVHAKFETKNFSEFFHLKLSGLWIFRGVWVQTSFGHTKFEINNFQNFFIFSECSGLWIFWGGWGFGTNFLVTPNLRSKSFLNFFLYWTLWALNFFFWRWCLGTKWFWSHQISG